MNDVVHVLVYGLLSAFSPVALIATLAVLGTRHARASGTAFAAGFVLGQTAALVVVLVVGSVAVPSENGVASAALELAVGVLLLAAAARSRRPPRPAVAGAHSRTKAALAQLDRVTPRTAFSVAVPFGIGVKRLLITIFAASTIALAGTTRAEEVGLGALYTAVACSVVVLPVGVYLVAGKSADDLVTRSKAWIAANQRKLTLYSSLVFGVFFTVSGIVDLASS